MRKSRIRRLERALAQEDSGRSEFLEMIDRLVEEGGLDAFRLPKAIIERLDGEEEPVLGAGVGESEIK